jgi:hypothetical protein
MVSLDLDDADKAALIALLKQAIAADPFPMSARTRLLRSILAKLLAPQPAPERAATVKRNVNR